MSLMKTCPSCGYVSKMDDCDFCVKCGAMYPGVSRSGSCIVDNTPLPEDPLERGFVYMNRNKFADGILSWIDAFKENGSVSDQTYNRMISEATGCLLRVVMDRAEYARARLPDLAVSLDNRELVTDLMSELVKNKGICTLQTGMLGLLSEYMLLFIDCFGVYTDLRDLYVICDSSIADLSSFRAISPNLPAPDNMGADWGLRWIENYVEYVTVVSNAIFNTMSTLDENKMEALSDYWASVSNLDYKNNLMNALMLNIQLFKTGRFTSKMFLKGRDVEINEMIRRYMSAKISEEV